MEARRVLGSEVPHAETRVVKSNGTEGGKMSVLLFWISNDEKTLLPEGTSSTVKALQKVFGKFPLCLNHTHIATLKVMAIMSPDTDDTYRRLLDCIDKHAEIRVTVEN